MTESIPWPAQSIAEWMPLWKGAGIFLTTFILEDAAAIGAGLLHATGAISWSVAFASCFLGIWTGDVGLYLLARLGGRKWFELSRFSKHAAKVRRSEAWFSKRGTSILIFSRVMPGARLPTYLAAGFLKMPVLRFLLVTGVASFIWTFVILQLTQLFGSKVLNWLVAYKHGGLLLMGVSIALVVFLQLLRIGTKQKFRKLARLRHWEFWPGWMFYPPVAIYCLWLAVKYRGLTLPTAANPGIFSGGIVGESKMAMLEKLSSSSPEFTAPGGLVCGADLEDRAASLQETRTRLGLEFPFILKPDVGQRGMGIKIIRTSEQAEDYLRQTNAPLVAQRYAAGPHEVGIFYYRFPHERRGRIFAITEKIFPKIVGDGQSTTAELIERDPRAQWLAEKYLDRFAARRNEILAKDEQLKLVEAGNHAQGCIFRDGMHLCTPVLESRIDEISRDVDGFYIGRYDIRYASADELRAGRNFQIIELNGAASEATSIYDARNSLWFAYRTLFQQWELVFAIGAANRARGIAPTRWYPVWQAWRDCCKQAATYPVAD